MTIKTSDKKMEKFTNTESFKAKYLKFLKI